MLNNPDLLNLKDDLDRLIQDVRSELHGPNQDINAGMCANFKRKIGPILSHSSTRLYMAIAALLIGFIILMIKYVGVSERLENDANAISEMCQNESSDLLTQMCSSINNNATRWEEIVTDCCDDNAQCSNSLPTSVNTYCSTKTDYNNIDIIMKIFMVSVLILSCVFITNNKSVHITLPERYTPIPDETSHRSVLQRIRNINIPESLNANDPIARQLHQIKRLVEQVPLASMDDIYSALNTLQRTLSQPQQEILIRYPVLGKKETSGRGYDLESSVQLVN